MSHNDSIYLKAVWRRMTPDQRVVAAITAGTTPEYLRQVLACGRQPGASMAKKIEIALSGQVKRHDLRPDIFEKHEASAHGEA